MNYKIIKPKSKDLKSSIDYFLFINSTGASNINGYTTIPNTNICLSIYKNNSVNWDRERNNCDIVASNKFGVSRLYGWHNKPFSVTFLGDLDQICIVFKPLGLSNFTQSPINNIDVLDDPFFEIFGASAQSLKQRLFEQELPEKRAEILEGALLLLLHKRVISMIDLCVAEILSFNFVGQFKVKDFCRRHKLNESTLYRYFLTYVGESAKKFEQKSRFRTFIKSLNQKKSLSNLSYALNYSDQSHLIKEVKRFTGMPPSYLADKLQSIDNELVIMSNT